MDASYAFCAMWEGKSSTELRIDDSIDFLSLGAEVNFF